MIAALENGYAALEDEGAAVANDLASGRIELNDMLFSVRLESARTQLQCRKACKPAFKREAVERLVGYLTQIETARTSS